MRFLHSRIGHTVPLATPVVTALLLLTAASASAYTVRKDQSEFFYQSTPLTYTPGRSTPAVAETTIRREIYFSDLDGGTSGWAGINFRAGMPNGWNIVTGSQACNGGTWWCGQTGLAYGDGYGNGWIQTLTTVPTTTYPLNLSGKTNWGLTFKMRARTEWLYDYGWILIKGANANARWDTLASYTGDFGSTCSNQSVSIPDSFATVMQPVTLQFLFGSDLTFSAEDSPGTYSGWSVDDVQVKSGGTVAFFDTMDNPEVSATRWVTASPNPGLLWHTEWSPGVSGSPSCGFLYTNVWVPFQGIGFGTVPDFADQMIITPAMDLAGIFSPNTPTTSLKLQFDQWINLPSQDNADISVYWSLWIQGSDDQVTWTPWRNALAPFEFSGGTPQCWEGLTYDFDPYDTDRTGVAPNTRYIKLGLRLRDEKAINACDCGGPLMIGVTTEGMYVDNLGVYYSYTLSGVETVGGVPAGTRTRIDKAYPNPFNPSTTIQFSVPQAGPVRLGIYDVHGRQVATLVNQAMNAGIYRIRWSGKDSGGAEAASGIYFAKVQSRAGSDTGRIALVK